MTISVQFGWASTKRIHRIEDRIYEYILIQTHTNINYTQQYCYAINLNTKYQSSQTVLDRLGMFLTIFSLITFPLLSRYYCLNALFFPTLSGSSAAARSFVSKDFIKRSKIPFIFSSKVFFTAELLNSFEPRTYKVYECSDRNMPFFLKDNVFGIYSSN